MATYAVSWTFKDAESTKEASWSETFYALGSTALDCYNSYIGPLGPALRRSILSDDYTLALIKVRNTSNRSDRKTVPFTTEGGLGTFSTPGMPPSSGEQPWDRLQINVHATGVIGHTIFQGTRQFPLGGLPEGVLVDTTQFVPIPSWGALFLAWQRTFLAPPAWQLRQRTFTPLPSALLMTRGPDTRSLIFTVPAGDGGDFTPGMIIQITGVQDSTNVNKLWRVRTSVGDTVYTFSGRNRIMLGNSGLGNVIQAVQYQYLGIDGYDPVRGMERKVGRFPLAFRGRARGRTA